MDQIKAVVVDPDVAGKLTVKEVDGPSPKPSEAVVRVAAISLNRGEVRRSQTARPGTRIGWDIAGTIETQTADGSGPSAGQRVVGVLQTAAWAELVAVPANALAVLPDSVSFSQAATLPVAGLTALYALEKGGSVLGRSVLVTGASGGVGDFAVQLGMLAGAKITGLVRQQRHVNAVQEAGAHNIVADETGETAESYGPYNLIVESVGGRVLANALRMLAPAGVCVSIGVSSGEPVTLEAGRFVSAGRSILYSFNIFNELPFMPASDGLSRLAGLIAEGKLHPRIEIEAPWTEIGPVAQQLIDRAYPGKAVLLVS